MTLLRLLILLGLSSTLSFSCATQSESEPEPESDAALDLAAAKALWESHSLKNYSLKQDLNCFCLHADSPHLLQIKENTIVDVKKTATNQSLSKDGWTSFKTVGQLFEYIELVQQKNPAELKIVYNSQYGYPSRISLDQHAQWIDDEITIETSELTF